MRGNGRRSSLSGKHVRLEIRKGFQPVASDQKSDSDAKGKPAKDVSAADADNLFAQDDDATDDGTAKKEPAPESDPPASEPDVTAEPEPPEPYEVREPDPMAVAPTRPAPARRGGFVAALLGGVVAAVVGFVAGKAGLIDPMLPIGWRTPDTSAQIAALEGRIDDQTGEIRSLRDQVGGIAVPDLAPLGQRIDALAGDLRPLNSELAALSSDLSDLEARLASVEKRPISEGVSQAAIDAYERELTRMRESLATQRTEVENIIAQARSMEAEASQSRQVAARRNALTRLQAALVEGAPYAQILEDMRTEGMEIPTALVQDAETGVATLAALRAAFPDAARQALAAAREASKGDNPGFSAFLARQFGARSVAPKAGDDPDAILSRAEAAVIDGRIDTALVELEALPEAARAPLADWIAEASRRQAAMNAADTLAQTLAAN